MLVDSGSYRDPSGNVYSVDNRIFRTVTPAGLKDYEAVNSSGLLDALQKDNFTVTTKELSHAERMALGFDSELTPHVLEHEKIPYISYPYEWGFEQLKIAALHHLDLQLCCFDKGFTLRDATAYNIQFIGSRPIFIDILSFKPYEQGEFWYGYTQFCEQFLYPLLLQSKLDIEHKHFYRGSLEGMTALALNAMLPIYKKLSLNALIHLVMPARLERKRIRDPDAILKAASKARTLKASSYRGFLLSLRYWIQKITIKSQRGTVWNNYETEQTYNDDELNKKRRFVEDFVKTVKPKKLFDLGCNLGTYSLLSRRVGAEYVVGFDFDQEAVNTAHKRSQKIENFLPLIMDASNVSPNHGWRQIERKGFIERADADALIALAFEHHLVIAKNIPMEGFIEWLFSIAPMGVVEFVPKEDGTVQKMLIGREDIFKDYTQDHFEALLKNKAKIVKQKKISLSGRVLYWYEKQPARSNE